MSATHHQQQALGTLDVLSEVSLHLPQASLYSFVLVNWLFHTAGIRTLWQRPSSLVLLFSILLPLEVRSQLTMDSGQSDMFIYSDLIFWNSRTFSAGFIGSRSPFTLLICHRCSHSNSPARLSGDTAIVSLRHFNVSDLCVSATSPQLNS
jgi:hypothetical protein